MRRLLLAALALLVVGCGGSDNPNTPDEPSLSAEGSWSGDTIDVEAETDLPDGALVTGYAVDHDSLETDAPLEAADTLDGADKPPVGEVQDGEAALSLDVGHFAGDVAVVSVSFVPNFKRQPEKVTEQFDPNQEATWSGLVRRD